MSRHRINGSITPIPARPLPVLPQDPEPGAPNISDLTVAINEAGLTILVDRAIDHPIKSSGSGNWGAFSAGYQVNLQVSGGTIELPELQNIYIVRLDNVVITGLVEFSLDIDLSRVLPQICIPPRRSCIHTSWGNVCTPQVCISWPKVSVPVPIPIPPIGINADFGIAVYQQGNVWQVDLRVYPFSLYIDLTPSVDLILDTTKNIVHDVLSQIPLIGDLVDGLVDVVLDTLRGVLDTILAAIKAFMENLILAIDLFSPTIPYHLTSVPVLQKIIAAGSAPGDREVDLKITGLSAITRDHELIVAGVFAS